jgi:hypothetical protein
MFMRPVSLYKLMALSKPSTLAICCLVSVWQCAICLNSESCQLTSLLLQNERTGLLEVAFVFGFRA